LRRLGLRSLRNDRTYYVQFFRLKPLLLFLTFGPFLPLWVFSPVRFSPLRFFPCPRSLPPPWSIGPLPIRTAIVLAATPFHCPFFSPAKLRQVSVDKAYNVAQPFFLPSLAPSPRFVIRIGAFFARPPQKRTPNWPHFLPSLHCTVFYRASEPPNNSQTQIYPFASPSF